LNEWIDHGLTPEELADGLTSLGLESRIVDDKRGIYEGIVVGKVVSCSPHPDADKLSVTKVDAGTGSDLPIVCGAANVAQGQTVAVALPGSTIPGGLKIEKRKLRGEPSEGMICSEKELGISEEAVVTAGIMVLDDSLKAGTPISEAIELEDTIIEIDLTPDRGDCLGLLGVAREVKALTGKEIKFPAFDDSGFKGIDNFEVEVKNSKNSPRYTAREVNGVTVASSPLKMRRRLTATGFRPINNIVDITNYVMMETGHPLHAFDRRDIAGDRVVVRDANAGEEFVTLDGRTHKLSQNDLLIADGKKGIALAGIMGGQNSEIKEDTKDVILEAAYFSPLSTRITAKRLNTSTDSSYRFERGINIDTVPLASGRAAALMKELGGGEIGEGCDIYPAKAETKKVTVRTETVNSLLGQKFGDGDVAGFLARLGFEPESGDGELTAVIPAYRHDIEQEADLIEEVARLYGYGNIKPTTPHLAQHESRDNGNYLKRRDINRTMAAAGLTETVNYSFINPKWRQQFRMVDEGAKPALLSNPINADWSELRLSLLPGLMNCAAFNIRHGEENVSIFETGAVFRGEGDGVSEEFRCAGVITSGGSGSEEIFGADIPRNFFRLKGILQTSLKLITGQNPILGRPSSPKPHLYTHRQMEVTVGGEVIGTMGQVHTLSREPFDIEGDIFCFEFSVDRLVRFPVVDRKVAPIPRLPGIKRDIALIVDETEEVASIIATVLGSDTEGGRIKSCRLFDLYRGKQVAEGKKSLAFRIFILDEEKTMTDEAGDELIAGILRELKGKHSAELRG
jgi:phenylalanyl-tRNA synthetase beta chain